MLVDECDQESRRQRAEDDDQPASGEDVSLVMERGLRLGHRCGRSVSSLHSGTGPECLVVTARDPRSEAVVCPWAH